jgi:hypothetical protein
VDTTTNARNQKRQAFDLFYFGGAAGVVLVKRSTLIDGPAIHLWTPLEPGRLRSARRRGRQRRGSPKEPKETVLKTEFQGEKEF